MPDKKPQIEKFREAARELGIDQSDAAFERALKKVAKAPKLSDDEIKKLAKQTRAAKENAKASPPKQPKEKTKGSA